MLVACVVCCAGCGLGAAESLSGNAPTITIVNERPLSPSTANRQTDATPSPGFRALIRSVDWSLLQTDLRGFAESYDVREIWPILPFEEAHDLGGPGRRYVPAPVAIAL